jgi:RNA polymerase sigma-70 factor (ECF subfamily)
MSILRYQQPLVNYLGRMTGEREAALDFAQDIFLKAYASLDSYRPSFKFATWLFTIASHHMIDHWRKKRIPALSLDSARGESDCGPGIQVEDTETPVARRYELAELRAKIEKALEKLPPDLREPFVLRHVNEFSYEEIADIKGLPVGTVKNRVFQAKGLLRRELGEIL